MKIIEILLKLGFLGESIYLFITKTNDVNSWNIYLTICILLGLVLMLNKKASYNFKQSKRDLMIRRIEGAALIIFAVVVVFKVL
jgi:hypothetical protein